MTGLLLGSVASAQIENFDSLNGYGAGLELRLATSQTELVNLRSPHAGWTVGLDGQYYSRDVSPAADRLKRDNSAHAFGLTSSWGTATWSLGATIGTYDAQSDYVEVNSPAPTPTNGEIDTSATTGDIWLVGTFGKLTADVSIGFSGANYKGTRRSDVGSSNAKFDGSGSTVALRFAYDYEVSSTVSLTPFVGIVWAKADADGFTEQGTAPDRRIVGDFSAKESDALFGLRLAGKSGAWRPALALGWFTELSSDPALLPIKAINGFDLGSGEIPNASKSLFYAGLQVDGQLDDNWSVRGAVNYFTGGDEEQTGFSLAITRGF